MSSIDWIESLEIGAAVLPPVLVLAGTVPNLATSARARWRHEPAGALPIQVQHYMGQEDWALDFHKDLNDGAASSKLRNRSLRWLRVGSWLAVVACVGIFGLLLVQLIRRSVFYIVLLVVLLGLAGILLHTLRRTLRDLEKNKDRATAANPVTGCIRVHGEFNDVHQCALFALRGLGARVVSAEAVEQSVVSRDDQQEAGQEPQILAIAGILGGLAFVGEMLEVSIFSDSRDHQVHITSTKLDFVTFSRSKRNVAQFMAYWMSSPTARPASDG